MDGTTLIVLTVLGLIAYQVMVVAWFPWGPCRRCAGKGKLGQKHTAYWRTCPRCEGKGKRVRLGRIILNAVSAKAREKLR